MTLRATSWVGLLCLTAAACGRSRAPVDDSAPRNQVGATRATATVSVGGRPVTAGDVLAVDAAGAVLAQTPIRDGAYQFEVAPGPAARAVVARLEAPAIGVVRAEIVDGVAPALAVAAADVIALEVTVVPPTGGGFDWVSVAFTPVSATVPTTTVLWADAQGGLRGAMVRAQHTSPRFSLAVVRGDYRVAAERITDAPVKPTAGEPQLTLAGLDHGAGPIAATSLAGVVVPLTASGPLTLTLRALTAAER